MRQRIIVVALIVSFGMPALASAQESRGVRAATNAAAKATPLVVQPAPAEHPGNRYFWPGLVMIAGGATTAVLGATVAKKETCGVVAYGYSVAAACTEETNKPLLWVGIGAAAGGATLMAIGGAHHQVAIGASSVKYRFRF